MSVAARAARPRLSWLKEAWALGVLIAASVLIVYGALVLVKASPAQTGWDLLKGSLGSAAAISGTLREVTPLLISGIAVFLGLKAGLFNIGVEGQFTIGALAATMVALKIPGLAGIILAIVAGMAAGGLLALPAGAIKAYRGGHEVITTIMLNNVVGLIATALVAGPLKAPNTESPETSSIAASSHLPDLLTIGNLEINSGLLIGVVVAIGLGIWLRRGVSGFELRAAGANATAARFAGINNKLVILKAMTWSGAIGGLAGAAQVLGSQFYFAPDLSSGYGFDALGVALLAGSSPAGLLPSSALFGVLNKGGTSIQVNDQVPKGIMYVVLGLFIVIAAAIRYRKRLVSDG